MIAAKNKLEKAPGDFRLEKNKTRKQGQKRSKRARRSNRPNRKKSKSTLKLFVMGLAILALVLSLFILRGYANISKMRSEITDLEAQKTALMRKEEELLSELEKIKSSLKIENDAIIKLGMDFPREDQLTYVNVGTEVFQNQMEAGSEFVLVEKIKSLMNLVSSLF